MNNFLNAIRQKGQQNLLLAAALLLALLVATILAAGQDVSAQVEKVTICHRTDSVKHPYNRIEVDADAADGNTGNDNGKGDHSQHTGPVGTSEAVTQALKDDHKNWGDIIPAHHNYAGLNWDANGQAVYNNGCKYTSNNTTTDDDGDVLGGTTQNDQSNQATAAAGGVGAGFGGGAGSITASALGLAASLGMLGYGAFSLLRKNS
jgi:hypothetical protein